MSIRRTSSGKYQARVMLDGRSHSATFEGRSEAREWEEDLRARQRVTGLPSALTVASYVPQWLAGYESGPAATLKFHETNCRLYLVPALGDWKASTVKPSDVAAMLDDVGERVSVAKADSVYRTASALFSSMEADDVVLKSPVRSKRHKPRRQAEPKVALEAGELKVLLASLRKNWGEESWQADTATLQAFTGARYGEIAGLTPHDVSQGTVVVRRRWSASDYTVRATKNHRLRKVALPSAAKAVANRLKILRGEVKKLPSLNDKEVDGTQYDGLWLVQTESGRPPNLPTYNNALREAAEQNDLPHVSSHVLRHTYVSLAIKAGFTAEQVSQVVGCTPQTLMKVYAHVLTESSRPFADAMDRMMA